MQDFGLPLRYKIDLGFSGL